MKTEMWPALPLDEWRDTLATVHMWAQIVGKIRMKLTPLINHWWNAALYVSARGLTTSSIPYGDRIFEIEFDFIAHKLKIESSDGATAALDLRPKTVADFYSEVMQTLHGFGIDVKIYTVPQEVPSPFSAIREAIPFEQDHVHKSYDAEAMSRFWRALISVDRIFKEFRTMFVGKVSPVHFWWGSFDHAVTFFSGRRAPQRADVDRITAEGYSHEVISQGFWPGGGNMPASFYSYTAPEPPGFSEAKIKPAAAYYSAEIKEFFLPYDAVRQSASPENTLKEFLHSTYETGANLAKWDRAALERAI